jgi:spermidine/putrescine transport system ATP-binding protein
MALLEIVDIDKEVDGQIILNKINLGVNEGEFFSLLGSSGCGKTTLLRLIAGLDKPSGGQIRLDGKRIDNLPPQHRPTKMVFQKYALFPHMTVFDNVAFGLRLRKLPAVEIRDKCMRALDMFGLKQLAGRKPETLSGGQQQRVAVARALVNEPRVLLLDEPLSALDQKMREHMQDELRALQKRLGLTFIYVTHDQEEAMVLSDRIGVMNSGRLEQVASPRDLYDDPKTFFVASFVGQMTKLSGALEGEAGKFLRVSLPNGEKIQARKKSELSNGHAIAFVRPEKILVIAAGTPPPPDQNVLTGKISQIHFRGDQTELEVDCGLKQKVSAYMMSSDDHWKNGENVKICFCPEETWLFDEGAT